MSSRHIPFNRPSLVGNELEYIRQAVEQGHLSGDGPFTRRAERRLELNLGARRVFLTHSCTAALELSALLLDLQPGDEVIMPSFTFVSTANAFALRRARPVFVEIRGDTLNLDETRLEAAIGPRTRAVVAVHYAGVACEMEAIIEIAGRRGLRVVEDAAQGLGATYRGRPLGTLGDFGCLSFHETKNVISGEGGALIVRDEEPLRRAEILREKGTNRSAFLRGQVDKYTWVDIGSSYLPSEIVGAFLLAQLEKLEAISAERKATFALYRRELAGLEEAGCIRLPVIPASCHHNGHLFYVLTASRRERDALLRHLTTHDVNAVFHYVPLHLSPMGRELGYGPGDFPVTEEVGDTLLRLPLHFGLPAADVRRVCGEVHRFFGREERQP